MSTTSTALRRGRPALACALAASAALTGWAGCGKKGPPLAPILRVPARIDPLLVRRQASTVFVEFAIPAADQDGSTPADIRAVEVYGFTGSPGPIANLYRYGTLVATVPVRRPPEPSAEEPSAAGARQGAAPVPPRRPVPDEERGFEQGATVAVTEVLSPDLLAPVVVPGQEPRVRRPASDVAAPLLPPAGDEIPARIYVAVGVSRRGRRGPPSARVSVPLIAPVGPPAAPVVTYTEAAVSIAWTPPAGARRSVQGPATGTPLEAKVIGWAGRPSLYNVYEVPAPSPAASVPAGAAPPLRMPMPINEKPVEKSPFDDPRVAFGTERCHVVRVVDQYGAAAVEGEASAPTCVRLIDTFPPAQPKGLGAIASEGAVDLIWEANAEKDLAGYLILRGEAPGTSLRVLTPGPIKETTFRDDTVTRGARYVYVVIAVDSASPSNVSRQSNRIEAVVR